MSRRPRGHAVLGTRHQDEHLAANLSGNCWTFPVSSVKIAPPSNPEGDRDPMTLRSQLLRAVLLAALALPAFAQTFGEITGRVTDASGAAAPESVVIVTNMSTNATRRT